MKQRAGARILVNIAMDGALAALAALCARWLADPGGGFLHPLWFLAGGGITLLLAGLPLRLQQQYWRFSGLYDLIGVAAGSVVSAGLFAGLFLLSGFHLPTTTFPIVHAMTLGAFLAGPRVAWRLWSRRGRAVDGCQPVLLVGAQDAADALLQALARDPRPAFDVVGLLALSHHQIGRRIHGLPILGLVEEAAAVLDGLARKKGAMPTGFVVTEANFVGPPLAALTELAEARGMSVRRAKGPAALTDAERLELREVAIEDLLNRPQVELDRAGMRDLIAGKTVLLTGAGGSIGSEIARQVAQFSPKLLVLLDHSEFALWQIDLEIFERAPKIAKRAVIADVRDARAISALCEQIKPDLVFHAAALKHVPMVEANPIEGVMTNAIGTRIVADCAAEAGAQAMVLISTDKAVNPSSLMGASKRLAEMYCQAADVAAREAAGFGQAAMRVVTVRFGNVLGSTGSVIPLFRRQLERGGPLTVTHPDMMRYFMTVGEAVSLVLEASSVALRGAALPEIEGGIFVLDMGAPVKIADLARQMITLAGLRPDRDIKIDFTGVRPGEKLFEELFHGAEPPVPTAYQGLLMASPRLVEGGEIAEALDTILGACSEGDIESVLIELKKMVPEYSIVLVESDEEKVCAE
jgi:O-antigen biosynthesis protein WbqV